MDTSLSLIHLIVIIGAVQGFTLCAFVAFYRKAWWKPRYCFVIFLSSLAILNLTYVILDLDLLSVYRPLHLFPYPYKWLIGPSIFFYVLFVLAQSGEKHVRKQFSLLWLPAIAYAVLSSYWFIISAIENSYRITAELVDSNFFRVNELCYLLFTLCLTYLALRKIAARSSGAKNIDLKRNLLLRRIILIFGLTTLAQLIIFCLDLILHDGKETFSFIYATLALHILFIYILGYLGFTRSSLLFPSEPTQNEVDEDRKLEIESKLRTALVDDELYRNSKLTLSALSNAIDIPIRDISNHIRTQYGTNFSEYINSFRIQKVKELLESEDSEKFTLLHLAEEAGFSSKSTFNATFKKLVDMTPSQYRKHITRLK